MTSDIIRELANRGIAHKATSEDGVHFFEGMGNKFKASISFGDNPSLSDSINSVIQKINMRKTEWEDIGIEKVPENDIDAMVPLKTGPMGGLHVMIDGTWMRVRKEI